MPRHRLCTLRLRRCGRAQAEGGADVGEQLAAQLRSAPGDDTRPTTRCASTSVATPTTVAYRSSSSSRGSLRRIVPASISSARNVDRPLARAAPIRGRQPGRPPRARAGSPPAPARAAPGGARRSGTPCASPPRPGRVPAGGAASAASRAPAQLVGAAIDDGVEQGLLGREPVQDRLLGDARARRRGRRARSPRSPARAERVEGGVEDAVRLVADGPDAGTATLPNGRQERVIAEALAGKRIAITGSTGFVGTALVERLLRSVPDCELVLLVRAGQALDRRPAGAARDPPQRRLRPPPRRARQATAFDAMVGAPRRRSITGDVGTDGLGLDDDDRAALASCDIVIHSAATVAFDSPARPRRRGQPARPDPHRRRPLHDARRHAPPRRRVAPATWPATAGARRPRSSCRDGPFDLGLDWRAEVAAARRPRADAEAESRTPEQLAELPQGGPRASSAPPARRRWPAKTEQLPRALGDRPHGRGRPGPGRQRSAGPTPTPTRRPSASRRCCENQGDVPVIIVRPSIIESALAEPRPGWIRGFRMAEPVIISYARGLLKEFPGVPEGTVDVIPVDLVVAAIIAVAAARPRARRRAITQVASGSVNPLKYRAPRRQRAAPGSPSTRSTTPTGQPIVVPEWSFPGRGRVQGQLNRAKTSLDRGEKVLQALPAAGQAGRAGRPGSRSKRDEVERALDVRRALRRLHRVRGDLRRRPPAGPATTRSTPTTSATFSFDPRVIDWTSYITDDPPAVGRRARPRARPRRARAAPTTAPTRLRRQVLSPERHLAAFDLENTLIASQRGGELLVAGHPPARPPTSGCASCCARSAEAPGAAGARPQGPQRLPALLLPPLRGRPGRRRSTTTPAELLQRS